MRGRGVGVRDAADLARLPPPDPDLLARCEEVVAAFGGLPQDPDRARAGPPRHPAGLRDVLRDDAPRPGLLPEEALAAAPDAVDGAFRAPRVRDVR